MLAGLGGGGGGVAFWREGGRGEKGGRRERGMCAAVDCCWGFACDSESGVLADAVAGKAAARGAAKAHLHRRITLTWTPSSAPCCAALGSIAASACCRGGACVPARALLSASKLPLLLLPQPAALQPEHSTAAFKLCYPTSAAALEQQDKTKSLHNGGKCPYTRSLVYTISEINEMSNCNPMMVPFVQKPQMHCMN